ncbi:hypothetical protein OGH69_02065 [Flavobacterium sp. MFBS3-15]|uniref:hypothetical protein n=1 Tax=Flavobacterium sp. MFBS3-15 TaxID=2989816 RepID=UPI00223699F6|nr:hypothetical protein [Flavobacterium sp. MFBS3-15]MCW4467734.1 hypothetical protein [Flavobacterium sp. MFBS3-15]
METTHHASNCTREKGCIDHNDSAGTKPNRNNYEPAMYSSYKQNFTLVPNNHPEAAERLLHPDKGELNN